MFSPIVSDQQLWVRAVEVMGKDSQVVWVRKWLSGDSPEFLVAEVTLEVSHPHFQPLAYTYYYDKTIHDETPFMRAALDHLARRLENRHTYLTASPGLGSAKNHG